jgi:tRNA (guanine-N7-)-methyltransferase
MPTSSMIEITSPFFIAEQSLHSPGDLIRSFGNSGPLALEIGCGIGDFIVDLAAGRPETNFLAVDIYNKGCLKTCRKIEAKGLQNVRVMRAEARHLLTHYFSAESLTAIYINCPDPWPKKRHRRRRLVNADFLRLALYYLRSGGELIFSTDFVDYAEEVANTIAVLGGYRNCLAQPYVLSLPGYPSSKYMKRFLDQGMPIHFIHYCKKEGFTAAPPLPSANPGFPVRWRKVGNE